LANRGVFVRVRARSSFFSLTLALFLILLLFCSHLALSRTETESVLIAQNLEAYVHYCIPCRLLDLTLSSVVASVVCCAICCAWSRFLNTYKPRCCDGYWLSLVYVLTRTVVLTPLLQSHSGAYTLVLRESGAQIPITVASGPVVMSECESACRWIVCIMIAGCSVFRSLSSCSVWAVHELVAALYRSFAELGFVC
jgi:hypothetical protein